MVSTNHYSQLRGLIEYLVYDFPSKIMPNFWVVLNQIPIGAELVKSPIILEDFESLKESKIIDTDALEKCKTYISETDRDKDSYYIFETFELYSRIIDNDFLSLYCRFCLIPDEKKLIQKIVKQVFIIPEIPTLRKTAAFFEDNQDFFKNYFSSFKDTGPLLWFDKLKTKITS